VERYIVDLAFKRNVGYAGPLAGYSQGLIEQNGTRILVTNSPKLLKPEKGNWDGWRSIIDNLFKSTRDVDQRYFHDGWVHCALRALYSGEKQPGQCLVVAGKVDKGKSFWQNMLTHLLGGRAAKPYQYMAGDTTFNRQLFGAEHLMIEDVISSTDLRARRNFGARIKELTVNEQQECSGKHIESINVQPFWRVTITVNDEPEDLLVLPPLIDSLAEKFMLLKAHDARIPQDVDRKQYRDDIVGQLPAYVHWLMNEYRPPEQGHEHFSKRFGISHYHHPELLAAINDMSPEIQLINMIDTHIFNHKDITEWEGTADQLRKRLMEDDRDAAKSLLGWVNATGTYLGRLAKLYPERFYSTRSDIARSWRITSTSVSTKS
jgi:hypothetical protein